MFERSSALEASDRSIAESIAWVQLRTECEEMGENIRYV